MDKENEKHVHTRTDTHSVDYCLAHTHKIWNEILPFATTWVNIEGIMLSEINQTEKDKYSCFHLYVKFKI